MNPFTPRKDAALIEFSWFGRPPAAAAIDDAPECIRRARTIGDGPILYLADGQVWFVGNAQNADRILLRPDELDQLTAWLDKHFSNGAGGHWTERCPFTGHWRFQFCDHTEEEIRLMLRREKIWETLPEFLDRNP